MPGASVLLVKPSSHDVIRLLWRAKEYGVRRLRLLFSERDGRASTSGAFYSQSGESDRSALSIFNAIRSERLHEQFSHISISDPFDIEDRFSGLPTHSCMLRDRRMWTIASDGMIYSCCFNVHKPAHAVGYVHALSDGASCSIPFDARSIAQRCSGLSPSLWGASAKSTTFCPIRAISI